MGIVAAGIGLFVDLNGYQCIAAIVRGNAETGRGYQQQERDGYIYQLSDDHVYLLVTQYKCNAILFIMFKSAYCLRHRRSQIHKTPGTDHSGWNSTTAPRPGPG
jgi:hypothetical protein